jgi:hypothetical protein
MRYWGYEITDFELQYIRKCRMEGAKSRFRNKHLPTTYSKNIKKTLRRLDYEIRIPW